MFAITVTSETCPVIIAWNILCVYIANVLLITGVSRVALQVTKDRVNNDLNL